MKVVVVIGLLLAAGCGYVFKPWSAYSVIDQYRLFHPAERVDNFRQMDRIFPARPIHSSGESTAFARDERPLPISYQYKGRDRTLDKFLSEAEATGLLVIQNNVIVHERYFQGADETSRLTSWSVAKSVVGTLVGIALQDGLIKSIDEPVDRYLPSLSDSSYAAVPIKHILQMSSGVEFDEDYKNRFSDINLFFAHLYVLGREADDVIEDYPRARESGVEHDYISIDTHVLGMLLRHIYNKPLAQIVEQRLWQPLGMEADAYWSIDDEGEVGNEIAFCCLNARLRDYARIGLLYLNDGVWNGQRLLPEGWVAEATTPGAPHLEPGATAGWRGYQYHWWIPPDYNREYFASGVWGQYIYVSEPDDLVIVRTSVDPDFKKHLKETVVVFRAIRDYLRQADLGSDQ